MGFDLKAFEREKLTIRTEEVEVPQLAPFFGEGEAPVWKIRQLEGEELAKVREAAERTRAVAKVLEAIASSEAADKVEGVREILGHGTDVPPDLARRLDILTLGSVEPAIGRPLAVRLAKFYAVDFYKITDAIIRLSGLGAEPGKLKGSGGTPTSEPRSVSGKSSGKPSSSSDPTSGSRGSSGTSKRSSGRGTTKSASK